MRRTNSSKYDTLLKLLTTFVIVSLTILHCSSFGKTLFMNISNAENLTTVTSPVYVTVIITCLLLIAIFYFKRNVIRVSLLVFLLITWILSSRTVSIYQAHGDYFVTGWFHIPLNKHKICSESGGITNGDGSLYYKRKSLWSISLRRGKDTEISVFLGPLTYSSWLELAEKEFGIEEY